MYVYIYTHIIHPKIHPNHMYLGDVQRLETARPGSPLPKSSPYWTSVINC